MLEGRDGVSARRGRHLYEAGDLESAIPVLLDGAKDCFRSARNVLGWELLSLRENALRRLKVEDTDIRWAEGWMVRERFLARRKEFPAVLELVDKILEKTRYTKGARKLRAMAWHRKGSIHRVMSEPEEARACLNKAMQGALDDPLIMSHAMEQLGTLELAYGTPILAARFYEGALDAAKQLGDTDRIFQVRTNMAAVCRRQGDIETAREHLMASLVYYERSGAKRSQSRCLNDMAELDRFKGDLQRAEDGYLKALSLLEALGDQRFYVAALNLGIIYAETGRPVEARAQLEQCHRALRSSRLPGIEGATLLALAHVHAQLSSVTEWRKYFDEGRAMVEETGFADIDIARSAQHGGETWLADGQEDEARESLEFARDHWTLLERDDLAAQLTDLLSEISG
jgi:tetratricopeptide (TPR) repeat protein